MKVPEGLLYTNEHEWIRIDGAKGVVGVTDFAQDQLGDVVFVDLPAPDTALEKNKTLGVVESVKTVSDLYAPVSGKVIAVNKDLEAQPELVNKDPYGQGWMVEIELSDAGELSALLTPEKYAAFIQED